MTIAHFPGKSSILTTSDDIDVIRYPSSQHAMQGSNGTRGWRFCDPRFIPFDQADRRLSFWGVRVARTGWRGRKMGSDPSGHAHSGVEREDWHVSKKSRSGYVKGETHPNELYAWSVSRPPKHI